MPQDVNPIIDRLVETFPACFSRKAPQPLKIGLGEEVMALAGVHPALADLTRTRIRRALQVYTGASAYRKALAKGGPRYGLDGQPAGEVTPEQQTFARKPRPKRPASPAFPPETAPKAPEGSPTPGYLKMTLKRRVLPGAGE